MAAMLRVSSPGLAFAGYMLDLSDEQSQYVPARCARLFIWPSGHILERAMVHASLNLNPAPLRPKSIQVSADPPDVAGGPESFFCGSWIDRLPVPRLVLFPCSRIAQLGAPAP